jgi:hypothetical protein
MKKIILILIVATTMYSCESTHCCHCEPVKEPIHVYDIESIQLMDSLFTKHFIY